MRIEEIWHLPAHERTEAAIDRWLELSEMMGCRTEAEKAEMWRISDAILPVLIAERRVLKPPAEGSEVE